MNNKIITYENLTSYNDALYNRIGKQWDFSIENAKAPEDTPFMALLELGPNPSHYKFYICRETFGSHVLSEVYVSGNIQQQGKYTGYAINSDEFYICWGGGKTYLCVQGKGDGSYTQTYKIKVVLDAQYAEKWKSSVKEPAYRTFCGGANWNIPNLIKQEPEPIDEDKSTTEIVITSNGAGICHNNFLDFIVDNTNDESDNITVSVQEGSDFPNGVYRFAIKENIDSFTLVDGSTTTTYDKTKIYKDGILTYTKEIGSDGTVQSALEYTFPNIYSPDDSINVVHTNNGSTELTTNINAITKYLHVKDRSDARALAKNMKFDDMWEIDNDVTHIHIEEDAQLVLMGIWPKEGQTFKNGQRLTISGWFKIGEGNLQTVGEQDNHDRANFSRYYYSHVNYEQSQDPEDYNLQFEIFRNTINPQSSYAEFITWTQDEDNADDYANIKSQIKEFSENKSCVYTKDWNHASEAFEEFIYWNGRWYDRGYLDPVNKNGSGSDLIPLNNHSIETDEQGYFQRIPQDYTVKEVIDLGTFNNLLSALNTAIGHINSLQEQVKDLTEKLYWQENVPLKQITINGVPDTISAVGNTPFTVSLSPENADVDLEYSISKYVPETSFQSLDDDEEEPAPKKE